MDDVEGRDSWTCAVGRVAMGQGRVDEWLEMMLRYELDDEIDEPCLWQDLLRAAFGRINWSDIIENYIE
jgi:hypothetical protein